MVPPPQLLEPVDLLVRAEMLSGTHLNIMPLHHTATVLLEIKQDHLSILMIAINLMVPPIRLQNLVQLYDRHCQQLADPVCPHRVVFQPVEERPEPEDRHVLVLAGMGGDHHLVRLPVKNVGSQALLQQHKFLVEPVPGHQHLVVVEDSRR